MDHNRPDALKNGGKSTSEIKNVKQQSLTKQLRIQENISNSNGLKPELIINSSAKLSAPLKGSSFEINTYQMPPSMLKTDALKFVPLDVQNPVERPVTINLPEL